jgi:hypothetical protein
MLPLVVHLISYLISIKDLIQAQKFNSKIRIEEEIPSVEIEKI